MVPVPVVVVKEVEVTKLVPFEPTPPGFAPPPGWSPGMPRPDLSKTRVIARYHTLHFNIRYKSLLGLLCFHIFIPNI